MEIKTLVEHLKKTLPEFRKLHSDSKPEDECLTERFMGLCGLAQVITIDALKHADITCRPLASQSMQNWQYGHATVIAEIDNEFMLIDPTFIQFLGTAVEDTLQRTSAGKKILEELTNHGYLKLTPEKAQAYLSSLCCNIAEFPSDASAFSFITNPPHHKFHYVTGPGDVSIPPEDLKPLGFLYRPKV